VCVKPALYLISKINGNNRCRSTEIALVTFCDVRSEILSMLEQVLLLDLPLSHQKAVEQIMWKSVFYHVIEVFRQELAEFDEEHIRQHLLAIIDNVNNNTYIIFICPLLLLRQGWRSGVI